MTKTTETSSSSSDLQTVEKERIEWIRGFEGPRYWRFYYKYVVKGGYSTSSSSTTSSSEEEEVEGYSPKFKGGMTLNRVYLYYDGFSKVIKNKIR